MFVSLRNSTLNTMLSGYRTSPEDQQRLLALGADLPRAWDSAGANVETRKKIPRLLVERIVVDVVDDEVELVIHWHGGAHTRLSVKKKRVGQNRLATDADVVDLVRSLAVHEHHF
jgi:hypothetical protein